MNLIDTLRNLINELFLDLIKIEEVAKLITVVLMVLFWIILGQIVIKVVKSILIKTSKFDDKQTKQSLTLKRLLNNFIKAVFLFWIVLMILKEVGIDVLPVLAGAGVFAFAVGFGAQELIKDLISGLFLIIEKTFSIGDYITIKDISGTVLDIGLRRTKIQNWKGEIITLNNGDIKTVINSSLNPSIAVIDFNIDFRKDIKIFESEDFINFIKDFANNNEEVIDEGNPIVVTDLLNGHVTLRVTFKTNTRKHVGVERAFRKELLKYANLHNIDLEVPLVLEHDNLK